MRGINQEACTTRKPDRQEKVPVRLFACGEKASVSGEGKVGQTLSGPQRIPGKPVHMPAFGHDSRDFCYFCPYLKLNFI